MSVGLNRVRDDKVTCDRLLARIEELKTLSEKMTPNLTGMPRGGNSKTDDPWAMLADCKTQCEQAIADYLSDCDKLDEELDCIKNPKINAAMKYKYIHCYTLQQIADAMSYDERWIRRLLATGRKIYEREYDD